MYTGDLVNIFLKQYIIKRELDIMVEEHKLTKVAIHRPISYILYLNKKSFPYAMFLCERSLKLFSIYHFKQELYY